MAYCICNFGTTKSKSFSVLGYKTTSPVLRIAKNGIALAHLPFNYVTLLLVSFKSDLRLILAFLNRVCDTPPSIAWPGVIVDFIIQPNGKRFVKFTQNSPSPVSGVPSFRLGRTA